MKNNYCKCPRARNC